MIRAIVVNNKLVQGEDKKKSSKDQTNSAVATASAPGSIARSSPASPQASNSASPVNNRQLLLRQLSREPSQQLLSMMKPPSPTSASAMKHSHRMSIKNPTAPPYVSL
jgi:hypothetical protein